MLLNLIALLLFFPSYCAFVPTHRNVGFIFLKRGCRCVSNEIHSYTVHCSTLCFSATSKRFLCLNFGCKTTISSPPEEILRYILKNLSYLIFRQTTKVTTTTTQEILSSNKPVATTTPNLIVPENNVSARLDEETGITPLGWYAGFQPLLVTLPENKWIKTVYWLAIRDHKREVSSKFFVDSNTKFLIHWKLVASRIPRKMRSSCSTERNA